MGGCSVISDLLPSPFHRWRTPPSSLFSLEPNAMSVSERIWSMMSQHVRPNTVSTWHPLDSQALSLKEVGRIPYPFMSHHTINDPHSTSSLRPMIWQTEAEHFMRRRLLLSSPSYGDFPAWSGLSCPQRTLDGQAPLARTTAPYMVWGNFRLLLEDVAPPVAVPRLLSIADNAPYPYPNISPAFTPC